MPTNVRYSVHVYGPKPIWNQGTIEQPGVGTQVFMANQFFELLAPIMDKALKRSAILVLNDAKRLTPVDTGRLRASLAYRIDARPVPLFATVGTNVSYAANVHDGRQPGSMPPPEALRTWARRHGFKVARTPKISRRTGKPITDHALFALAMKIKQRGIVAKPFLVEALRDNFDAVKAEFAVARRAIEAAWS